MRLGIIIQIVGITGSQPLCPTGANLWIESEAGAVGSIIDRNGSFIP